MATTYTHTGRRAAVGYQHTGRDFDHYEKSAGKIHALNRGGYRSYTAVCGVVVPEDSTDVHDQGGANPIWLATDRPRVTCKACLRRKPDPVCVPTTYTYTTPPTKTQPRGGLLDWTPTDSDTGPAAGVLTLQSKRDTCTYVVCEFPTGWAGRGFHLRKLDGGTDTTQEAYSVFVGSNGNRTCECAGFVYGGRCKHLDAILTLIQQGQL